jgi:hypothetical protein
MLSTREELLSSFQRRYREVPLPSGRTVRIRNLTELERGKLIEVPRLNAATDAERRKAVQEEPCRWIVACVVDSDGQRLFKASDIPDLQQLDAADTRAIYVAAQEHVGSIPSVEDLEKNCEATNDVCSSSD